MRLTVSNNLGRTLSISMDEEFYLQLAKTERFMGDKDTIRIHSYFSHPNKLTIQTNPSGNKLCKSGNNYSVSIPVKKWWPRWTKHTITSLDGFIKRDNCIYRLILPPEIFIVETPKPAVSITPSLQLLELNGRYINPHQVVAVQPLEANPAWCILTLSTGDHLIFSCSSKSLVSWLLSGDISCLPSDLKIEIIPNGEDLP